MKYDGSRTTYERVKHYSRVLWQQGRVQVDADVNEQTEIVVHRAETEASDVIGLCGAPMHDPAFHIVADPSQLTAEERAHPANQTAPTPAGPSDFLISAGRYYVDGILCENEGLTSFAAQPDLPKGTLISADGVYVVYLDVWQRHLTALDDPSIRETALGGPDTATRAKTVWQVKWVNVRAGDGHCLTDFPEYAAAIARPTGTLAARETVERPMTNPCIVPPGAGYRGLENQLYRVEIHTSGGALDVNGAAAPLAVTRVPNTTNQVRFTDGTWEAGQNVELLSTRTGTDPLSGTLAQISSVEARSKTLTLNRNVSSLPGDTLAIRPVHATYKWSRDNGVVVTAIENIQGQDVTVRDLGPDSALGFDVGQWVEILDDERELKGLPGQLAQILAIDRGANLVSLNVAPTTPLPTRNGVPDTSGHPKLRRWDGVGAIKVQSGTRGGGFVDLENGVQIRFGAGSFRTGDYWTIPARTATADAQGGNIEWPTVGGSPVSKLPFGIEHHYCRLAVLRWNAGSARIDDCRQIFPPITELTSLFYVSGDGQEALPNTPIPQLLQVAVFNGRWPVAGARVRFVAPTPNSRLAPTIAGLPASATNTITVSTGADGVASCAWTLAANLSNPSQQVEARLLDAADARTPAVVRFNGNLSIAQQVSYETREDDCPVMAGRVTVQSAIDQIVRLVRLHPVSGNNQMAKPGAALEPLRVLAASDCGVVPGQRIAFRVITGAGTVTGEAITDRNGIATAEWKPDATTFRQEVEATLVEGRAGSTAAPKTVRFVAHLILPDPAIHVVAVGGEDGSVIENDMTLAVGNIEAGINITCDREPAPGSFDTKNPRGTAAKPTCYVTLDLPYPIDTSFWDVNGIIGFQPLILDATVTVKEREIRWRLNDVANDWLQNTLFTRLARANYTAPVLAHLTLKGNFIGTRDRPFVTLDGDTLAASIDATQVKIGRPSGDGRTGGDYEIWFWLAGLPTPPRPGLVLQAAQAGSGIAGTVRDNSGAPLPGITVTATRQVPGGSSSAITDAQGAFRFLRLAPGRYEVRADTVQGLFATQMVDVVIIGP